MYRIYLIIIALLLLAPPAFADELRFRPPKPVEIHQKICKGYEIVSITLMSFNTNEKKLICGDPTVNAWKKIPVFQAKYNMTNFLQDRGYFYPEFKEVNGVIGVYPGKQTFVTEIIIEGDHPKKLKVHRKRHVKGSTLTPRLLSGLESWISSELGNIGFPCAKISSAADAKTGIITVNIDTGSRYLLPDIDVESIPELQDGVLRRFDAFDLGKTYTQKWLTLTERRSELDGIVQNTYFVTECKADGIEVSQKTTAGQPRLFIFGIGADTEEYIKAKISWKHARLGPMGSSVRLQATGSYRKQTFLARVPYYFWNRPTRWHITPTVFFERRNERKYEYMTVNAGLFPRTSWDNNKFHLDISFGPNLMFNKTEKGANPGVHEFLSGLINLELKTHQFEFYDYDPRNGVNLQFYASLNNENVLSDISVQQFILSGEWLFNIGRKDPPLLILGFRGSLATSVVDRSNPRFGNLPPEFQYYLGGSANLRGFKREELPLTYNAGLTMAYLGAEVRLSHVLPADFQPIAFVDVGAMSPSTANLDLPVYWSPGFGMRWFSPFGVFRVTMAHGFLAGNNIPANNTLSHWQFYFSYGEEF